MNFLLNEQSLQGQFKNAEEFLQSAKPVIQCIRKIHEYSEMIIYKTMNFSVNVKSQKMNGFVIWQDVRSLTNC